MTFRSKFIELQKEPALWITLSIVAHGILVCTILFCKFPVSAPKIKTLPFEVITMKIKSALQNTQPQLPLPTRQQQPVSKPVEQKKPVSQPVPQEAVTPVPAQTISKDTLPIVNLMLAPVQTGSATSNSGQSSELSTDHVYTLGEVGGKLIPLFAPQPLYPEEAKDLGIQGELTAEIIISALGSVVDVKILKSPHMSITRSSIATLKKWKFKPIMMNGHGVLIRALLPIQFALEEE